MKEKHVIPSHITLVLVCIIFGFPFLYMVLSSFMTAGEISSVPTTLIPAQLEWENYQEILSKFTVGRWYLNSAIVVIATTFGQVFFASLAAYAFARLNFPGKEVLFMVFLSLYMVPEQIFIMPRFYLIRDLGLNNTLVSLFLPKMFSVLGVFMLKQFFSSLPKDLDEAAKIDGCGHFRIFAQVLMPLLKGPLVSLSILSGLGIWKDLLWPIIMIRDNDKKTVVAGLAVIQDIYSGKFNYTMVGGVLGSIVVIILFFVLQKHIVKGIASQGIKG